MYCTYYAGICLLCNSIEISGLKCQSFCGLRIIFALATKELMLRFCISINNTNDGLTNDGLTVQYTPISFIQSYE